MRYLIINADGYGFTEGTTRAIEDCIDFGTVRSISVNVNFSFANRLADLVKEYPRLSVGCHVNPIVGRPVLDHGKISSLTNKDGDFYYKNFFKRALNGSIRFDELYEEMMAQIKKTRDLAGPSFSHIDFHMGLHRLPRVYNVFLDVVEASGIRRIRTHRYFTGLESRFPKMKHFLCMFDSSTRIPKYFWNLWLRKKAIKRGFFMPDWRVELSTIGKCSDKITVENYINLLRNLPKGFSEFVVHPGYVDDDLKRWSTYHYEREEELKVLLSDRFRSAICELDVGLAGYRDIAIDFKK